MGWRKEFFEMGKSPACLLMGESELRWVVKGTEKRDTLLKRSLKDEVV